MTAVLMALMFSATTLFAQEDVKQNQEGAKTEATVAQPEAMITKPAAIAPQPEEKATTGKKNEAKLEEIVVTSTRTEKDIESAPGDVHVVTQKDIEKRNIKTVDEALNTLPGVFDRRGKGMMDTLANISMRGIPGSNRTLILKDGVPLNTSYTGYANLNGMEPETIERIEVVEGPFSSLYGGYAMGGVVNILTKLPDQREIVVKTGYGSGFKNDDAPNDLWKAFVSYGDKIGSLRLYVGYGVKDTNGYPSDLVVVSSAPSSASGITGQTQTTDNKGNTRYLIGDRGNNSWRDDDLTFKAGYDFSEVSKLRVSIDRITYAYAYHDPVSYLTNTSGAPVYSYGTVREASFLSGQGARETYLYSAQYETQFGSVKSKLVFGLIDEAKNWYTTPNTSAPYATLNGGQGKVSSSPSTNYNTDLQFIVPAGSWNILTIGGSWRKGSSTTEEQGLSDWRDENSKTGVTYRSGGKDETYALFLQDEIIMRDNLTFYLGGRQDWWKTEDGYADQVGSPGYPKNYESRSASSFSPKAALVYKPFAETTFRTSAGKAFRAPTTYELYRTWLSSTGVTYNGNPDLRPETLTGWDVSVDQGLWKGARAKVTYFESRIDDLIYRKTISATQQDYINAGKAEIKGVTAEIDHRFERARIFANATYTDAKITENDASPASVGKRLTQTPKNMYNAGVEATQGPVTATLTGNYVGKRYGSDDNSDVVNNVYTSYDPYFLLNAKVSYRVTELATVSVSVDNILDRDYFAYYKAPGRSWFAELAMKF
jgi:iron complex outermembrane receptor protein